MILPGTLALILPHQISDNIELASGSGAHYEVTALKLTPWVDLIPVNVRNTLPPKPSNIKRCFRSLEKQNYPE
jgi:hypothetical protein